MLGTAIHHFFQNFLHPNGSRQNTRLSHTFVCSVLQFFLFYLYVCKAFTKDLCLRAQIILAEVFQIDCPGLLKNSSILCNLSENQLRY